MFRFVLGRVRRGYIKVRVFLRFCVFFVVGVVFVVRESSFIVIVGERLFGYIIFVGVVFVVSRNFCFVWKVGVLVWFLGECFWIRFF